MSDLRRFSRVILVKDKDVSGLKEIRDLGPEPLEITSKQFGALFGDSSSKQKRGKLKQVLMDPFFIVGIGNIYSDEILWDSGFHPLSRVENLREADLKKIFKSTIKILNRAIRAKGSSIDDYRTPSGEKGSYQEMERAYQQTNKKCSRKDGGTIERIVVGGRSAHFCPKHQKLI
jgi:formamidopyrimidine-DNA glycosylase